MKKISVLLCVFFSFALWSQQVHILQKNETLYQLSRRFRVSVDEIMRVNNINDPTNISVGTKLIIPGEYTSYEVKKGDNLYRIARYFNIPAESLASMNGMRINDTLYVGQKLKVPGTETTQVASHTVSERVSSFYWPHNGDRTRMTGKLVGTQIQGKKGDTIVSVSSGKVIWVEPYRGYGNLIIVESSDKLHYVYGGNEENLVYIGQQVSPGTQLGRLGQYSPEGDAKVFFSVYKNGVPMDTDKAPRK